MAVNQVRRNGSYAPLSAYYYDDDAIIRAGEKAEVLYCRSLAFSARSLKDGFVTDAQVTRLGVGLTAVPARISKLVEVGLWEQVDGGYRVRQWLKWNASAEQIAEKQRKDADRKAGARP